MIEKRKKHTRRLKKLIICFVFTAIFLSVSTFAWFIGMRTVNVSSFDVEISGTDSLLLSLDGDKWDTTVTISETLLDTVSYEDHTNTWGQLAPVSSVGDMDVAASRMKLFEKSSMTASPGGYRILSSQINNYTDLTAKEPGGYVAFDLFIRNYSGADYITDLEILNEEAIYLTVGSEVTVSESGGVPNTGIENSVRVAFAQIGRVVGTTADSDEVADIAKITGITCNDDGSGNPIYANGVTGICRKAQIWEPNDRNHVTSAINWYKKSCLARTGEDVTLEGSYSGSCGTITNGVSYPTYAIKSTIGPNDNVDVYDGKEYNSYEDTILLDGYKSFTDTMKNRTGTDRPEFMRLAPNSVTKVRIYIYLEGQDIDNYDFASIGKAISVKFGFTKQRLTEGDIDYEGPIVNEGEDPDVIDLTAPVITLLGNDPLRLTVGSGPFADQDPGATALDNKDGDVTANIRVTSTVDTNTAGTYTVTYIVTDAAGNTATKNRTVIVE